MVFTPIWIFTVAAFVVSFLVIVLMSKLLTKPFDNIKFSFTRVFPFEVKENLDNYSSVYKICLYLFSALCFVPLFTFINDLNRFQNLYPLSIIVVCCYGLAGICFIFINFFNVTHVKVHLTIFVLFLSSVLLGNTLTTINGFLRYKMCLDHGENPLVLAICGGFAGVFAIILLLVALNPKLINWAKLEKIEGEENKYIRPKYFPLAYSEWIIFLLLFLGEIQFLLQLTLQ